MISGVRLYNLYLNLEIFLGQTIRIDRQMVRYLLSSSVAYLLDITTLIVCQEALNIDYKVASIIGFLIALTFHYFTSIYWVFDGHRFPPGLEGFLFIGVCLLYLPMTIVLLEIFITGFQLHYFTAKCLTISLVFSINYALKKSFLFPSSKHKRSTS